MSDLPDAADELNALNAPKSPGCASGAFCMTLYDGKSVSYDICYMTAMTTKPIIAISVDRDRADDT